MTDWIRKANEQAAAKVRAILDRPWPEDMTCRSVDEFDPWEIFPEVYGSYSSDFDECILEVLSELLNGGPRRDDLPADIFREMLCTKNLCEYGTSPRSCWPTPDFKALLPELVEKWTAYSAAQWAE